MRIETASGHAILADDADYSLLKDYGWYVNKPGGRLYAYARVPRTDNRVSMHRLLMSPPKGMVVHHKNNDGLDNRRCNLQITTQRVNTRYAHLSANYVNLQDGRWRAMVRDETGKRISLGMYGTEAQARAVVQNWNYRKMLELETSDDPAMRDIAKIIEENLTC